MDQPYRIFWNSRTRVVVPTLCTILITMLIGLISLFKPEQITTSIEPLSSTYSESDTAYNSLVADVPESTYSSGSIYNTIEIENYAVTESFESVNINMSEALRELILLNDSEAWNLVSNELFDEYPSQPYKQIESKVKQVYASNMVMITIDCWYWQNPNDEYDMSKITVQKKFAVNRAVADLFISVFKDIYNDPSKPIINIGDAGMGTWVLRGKNHSSNNTLSGHSMGTTIDINPSTGSFNINGTWYGNGYGHKAMPRSIWEQLPECHKKYHVLYQDCSIVQVFKSYGFVWGGDWTSGTDCMHFSFLGDGKNARLKGQANYYKYNG